MLGGLYTTPVCYTVIPEFSVSFVKAQTELNRRSRLQRRLIVPELVTGEPRCTFLTDLLILCKNKQTNKKPTLSLSPPLSLSLSVHWITNWFTFGGIYVACTPGDCYRRRIRSLLLCPLLYMWRLSRAVNPFCLLIFPVPFQKRCSRNPPPPHFCSFFLNRLLLSVRLQLLYLVSWCFEPSQPWEKHVLVNIICDPDSTTSTFIVQLLQERRDYGQYVAAAQTMWWRTRVTTEVNGGASLSRFSLSRKWYESKGVTYLRHVLRATVRSSGRPSSCWRKQGLSIETMPSLWYWKLIVLSTVTGSLCIYLRNCYVWLND